ncbi:DNA ligase [Rheinheimera mesophila]|uniref:DNA ligase n=1 Tax=Rheinheimera mesophila TaxID=1547515 RepID=A0A3P3QPS8_9GAMM|nr:DNA ligase [Rheinheimera mesophila]RRJ23262.1 DNA ligase [Rheinheimera mesophila]
MRTLYLSLCCTAMLTTVPAFGLETLPQLQLARSYQQQDAVADFWISEKLDGVRAFWDGKQLRSRSGQWIKLPEYLLRQLPAFALDAELWAGRGQFQQVMRALESGATQQHWQRIRLMVFDAPQQPGTFTERLQFLQQQLPQTAFVQLLPQQQLQAKAQLDELLQRVVAGGGEGLMLHHATALYQSGRVSHLQKLKLVEDAEARVVAHLPGKGQFSGMLGALLVELPDGRRFKLGSGFSLNERQNPPPIGRLVTFQYRGLTHKGTPRFAVFVRERSEP